MPTLATWNTQGNPIGNGKEIVLQELIRNFDVVFLQECGAFARIEEYGGNQGVPDRENQGVPDRGNQGNQGVPGRRVLGYEQAGAFNNRCSVAIIAERWDDFGLWSGSSTGRPGIWIRIGNFYYATIHCVAGGAGAQDLGPFAKHMMNVIDRERSRLVIGGDFNHTPGDLLGRPPEANDQNLWNLGTQLRRIEFNVHFPAEPTHQNGDVLDYFISYNAVMQNHPAVRNTPESDHHPVGARFQD